MDTKTVMLLAIAIDACRNAANSTNNGFVDDICKNAVSHLSSAMKMAMECENE